MSNINIGKQCESFTTPAVVELREFSSVAGVSTFTFSDAVYTEQAHVWIKMWADFQQKRLL